MIDQVRCGKILLMYNGNEKHAILNCNYNIIIIGCMFPIVCHGKSAEKQKSRKIYQNADERNVIIKRWYR